MLFAPSGRLQNPSERELIRDFLNVTFEGWKMARDDPRAAAQACLDVNKDAYPLIAPNIDIYTKSVVKCLDYVRRARCAGKYGVINGIKWARATEWLGSAGGVPSFDTRLYKPNPILVDGDSLAADILHASAKKGCGMDPKLVVITVGSRAEGHLSSHATQRVHCRRDNPGSTKKLLAGARCSCKAYRSSG